jgi:hypothetical protein
MKLSELTIFGYPVFGVILPYIGRRTIPLNRDFSVVDTGEEFMDDEVGWYFTKPLVIEWFGLGAALWPSPVYITSTGEALDDEVFGA